MTKEEETENCETRENGQKYECEKKQMKDEKLKENGMIKMKRYKNDRKTKTKREYYENRENRQKYKWEKDKTEKTMKKTNMKDRQIDKKRQLIER